MISISDRIKDILKSILKIRKKSYNTGSMEGSSDTPNNHERQKFTIKLSGKSFILPGMIILGIIIFSNVTFTVNEIEQAVLTRFGEAKTVIVEKKTKELEEEIYSNPQFKDVKILEGKGLFFRVPFIDQVEKYSVQLITYNTLPREVTTSDKKKIVLDNNAQWKINNPLLFRVTVNNVRSANTKLDDIIYSKLNEKIGLTDGSTLISDKKYVYEMSEQIKIGTNGDVKNFGMEVVDIRIAKTELPQENNENIYKRMRSERQKIANKFRSEGEEQYKIITAEADKEVVILKADAYEKAEAIRGEGDAGALAIYADAYNKDPEFYRFYKTLTTYKKTLGDKTKIVIDSNSSFARYLFGEK